MMCQSPEVANIALDVNDEDATTEDEVTETGSSEDEWDEDNNMTLRAKWTMDGATNIDECINKLNHFIEYLKCLKAEGWELTDPVDDDYGFLKKTEIVQT